MTTTHHATNHDKSQHETSKDGGSAGKLVLVRHTESEWNLLGKWTGRTDVHITENGRKQAGIVGTMIADIDLHHSYSSEQIRTFETFTHLIENTANTSDMPHEREGSLNERDYGDYTGMNKWEVLDQLGEKTFTAIRRSWDHPIPGGENLKMVYERAVPFYKKQILPRLLKGENVLVVSHGNTLRALIKYLDGISDTGIADVEMPFGQVLIYHVTAEGKQHTKQSRQADITPPKA